MNELNEYYREELKLVNDINDNKLTFNEANIRRNNLWDLIPSNIFLNSVRLNELMKEKFSDDPDWNKNITTFNIDGGNINNDDIENYIKKVQEDFKLRV